MGNLALRIAALTAAVTAAAPVRAQSAGADPPSPPPNEAAAPAPAPPGPRAPGDPGQSPGEQPGSEPSPDARLPEPAEQAPPSGAQPSPEPPPEAKPPEPTEVTVAGTRLPQTGGSAHVLREKQLQRYEQDDPHQVLLGVPGIYVRGEDGYGLRPNIGIRGAASDRSKKITLMEDGVLFGPAPYSAPAAYYFPLVTRMQAVRVIKGPSAIVYGPHTIGGAVDLVTASIPDAPKVSLDLAGGQYGYRKVHLRGGTSSDHLGLLVEGVHLGSTGFKELDGGGDTGFARNEWMAKIRWVPDPASRTPSYLELKAGFSQEGSNETYLGLTDADFRRTPYRRYGASRLDRMEWQRTQLQLSHRIDLLPELTLTTVAYRHDLDRTWRKVNGFRGASIADVLAAPDNPRNAIFYGVITGALPPSTDDEVLLVGPNDRTFVSQGLQATVAWRPRTGPLTHRAEIGVRVHYDSITRLHTEDGFLVQGTGLEPAGTVTATTADNFAESFALSMYAVDAVTWGRLTLTPGARLESIRGEHEDNLSGKEEVVHQRVVLPGLGAFLALPYDLGLLAGIYQGFSPVPPGSSQTPRPEKSVNYEVGARYSPRRFRAEWIGFFNDYQNLTDICTLSTGCLDQNLDRQFDAGRARVFGFETYVESELEVARGVELPGRVAYTFTNAEFLTDFESSDPIFGRVRAGDELPYVPAHQVGASIGVETKLVGAHLGGTYVAAMREVAGQGPPAPGTETDAYFLLDASASVRPLAFLTVYANARNLLDDAYLVARRPYGARPGAPRWIQVGVKLEH